MNLPAGGELIVILLIVLLLFGAKRLPDLANSMGRSIKEFRKASQNPETQDDERAETGTNSED